MRANSQLSASRWAAAFTPAIGLSARLPRRILLWRILTALALVAVLVVAKPFISPKEPWSTSLSSLPGGREMAKDLYVGGTVTDYDLQALATYFQVGSEVDLGVPDVADQVTAASLHLNYLYVSVAPVAPLSWSQLSTLARFMSQHAAVKSAVYIHDDTGGGRAVSAADMLLLLRGESWPQVSATMTVTQKRSLSPAQLLAIKQLAAVLSTPGHRIVGNPYSAAKPVQW